jgi:hypothetical protein
MSGTLPEAEGWALAHPAVMKRAAAAFTIEHLGASEWADIPGKGYAATGHNEYMNWPATAGPMTDMVVAGIKQHDLLRHAVEAGPDTPRAACSTTAASRMSPAFRGPTTC